MWKLVFGGVEIDLFTAIFGDEWQIFSQLTFDGDGCWQMIIDRLFDFIIVFSFFYSHNSFLIINFEPRWKMYVFSDCFYF